jgi:2'-5' RNA ligase
MEDRGSQIEDGEPPLFRLFVAISLPEEVKVEIEKAQEEMRRELPGGIVRWTRSEQFHLTLKFLGNVDVPRVEALTAALRGAVSDFAAFRLRAERIGFFPDMRFRRVVWVWVHDEKDVLLRLQQAIETSVRNFTAEKPEGKFTGHVTLGRIQRIKRPQAEMLAKLGRGMAERFFGEWVADKVKLIRSELSSTGVRYTTLAALPLIGGS